jgi:non-ribosomal peptide synthetase component E (peptide arylation enzyme)
MAFFSTIALTCFELGTHISEHCRLIRHFISPTTLVVLPSWNPEAVFHCIRKYRVTNMALVPSLVFQLLVHPKLRSDETDLSTLVGSGAGASYLPPAVSIHTQP